MKRPRRLSLNKLNDTADLREPSDGPRVRPVPGSLERERERKGGKGGLHRSVVKGKEERLLY